MTLQDGITVPLQYSPLDMGEIKHIFDGDDYTLARSWEANPFRLLLTFPQPRLIEQIKLRIGGEPTRIEAQLWQAGTPETTLLTVDLEEEPDPRTTFLTLPQAIQVVKVEIKVYNKNEAEPSHVHLWEVQFLPAP